MSSSWLHFVGALVGLVLAWDAYFFTCHRAFLPQHEALQVLSQAAPQHPPANVLFCLLRRKLEPPRHRADRLLLCCGYLVPRDVLFFTCTIRPLRRLCNTPDARLTTSACPCSHASQTRAPAAFALLPALWRLHDGAPRLAPREELCELRALAFTYFWTGHGQHHMPGVRLESSLRVWRRSSPARRLLPASPTGTTGEMRLAFEQLLTANSDMLHRKAADANIVKADRARQEADQRTVLREKAKKGG